MTLRKKIMVILSAMILCLIIVMYFISAKIVAEGFADLERYSIDRHMKRVLTSLDEELETLNIHTKDWAFWGDTYDFIQGNSDLYEKTNLVPESFSVLEINLMAFIDLSGEIVYARAFDLNDHRILPLPPEIAAHFTPKDILVNHLNTDSQVAGIILCSKNPMLIASRPITDSVRDKSVKGTLIMGRFLDSAKIEDMSKTLGIQFKVFMGDDPRIPLGIGKRQADEKPVIFIREEDNDRIQGYGLIDDIYGQPAFVIKIDEVRTVYLKGRTSAMYFLMSLLIIGAVLGFVILMLIDRTVLSRLKRFDKDIARISKTGDPSTSVNVKGTDELADLAHAINDMLNSLEISQKKLEKARKKAETSNSAKSKFLANMSHEIRTPMNSILGFAEILSKEMTDPKQQTYISNVQSMGISLLTLIDNILDLAKMEADKLSIVHRPFDPGILLKEIEKTFFPMISKKNLELIITTDGNLPERMILDENRVRQIFFNLIENAVKFTNAGHVRVLVKCDYRNKERAFADLSFCVEDTGIGIPSDQKEQIFDKFEQGKGIFHSEGAGLGLAVTKRLLEKMGGSIKMTGQPGKGSKFTAIIPNAAVIEAVEAVEKKKLTKADLMPLKKALILIVDDIRSNRKLLRGMLNRYNFKFIDASNGKECLEHARKHRPDLVLMDMKMPVMGGKEATMKIKADKFLGKIPVIACTASSTENEDSKIREICDGYLKKPINRKKLIEEVSRFLPCSASAP